MQTRKLFYDDVCQTEFSARVLRCAERDGQFAVTLDATCFYPEGGGQPADRGTLGGVKVLDVRERDGVIEHIADAPLPEGQTVEGQIDWARRLWMMQHHTAEHFVSGLALKLYGFNNVGFHMGEAMVTIDFDGPMDAAQTAQLELLANRKVFENLPVAELYPDEQALREMSYRSKKALIGGVRIIEVPGADRCACCGTHVRHTGQIGLIKLLSPQRHKGGVRLGLMCGERALLDYRGKDESTASISALLSVLQAQVADGVRRLLAEQEALRCALSDARGTLFALRCDAVGEGEEPVCLFEPNLAPPELRRLCLMLCERRGGVCAVFSGDDATGYRYALGSQAGDMRALSRGMHEVLGGRGGGGVHLAQGFIEADRALAERFFASLGRIPGA